MRKETLQDQILAMYQDGFTPKEMSESLGNSIGSIYATHAKFRIKPHKRKCEGCITCGNDANVKFDLQISCHKCHKVIYKKEGIRLDL
jgi:hypothetical protein